MTKIENKSTGAYYISHVSIEKKNWLKLMINENPSFFNNNDIALLSFMPLP